MENVKADFRYHFSVSQEDARNALCIELQRKNMELEQRVVACHKRISEMVQEFEQMKLALGEQQTRMDSMREWAKKMKQSNSEGTA